MLLTCKAIERVLEAPDVVDEGVAVECLNRHRRHEAVMERVVLDEEDSKRSCASHVSRCHAVIVGVRPTLLI